jgi:2-polyprenyl-3-methyl-5-hydroxy-6-metoxy-1,4-benzoquinol methylase
MSETTIQPVTPRALVGSLYVDTVVRSERLFGESYYGPFLNWGYWKSDTNDQREACRNLVELVLGSVPIGARLLDVGCGLGGLEEHLARVRPDVAVTGINVLADQLEVCRRRAPSARFVQMDATELSFADVSFDTVVCIEAAFHFPSRARFLAEAVRVLAPGGYLAMADIVSLPVTASTDAIQTPMDYQALLHATGLGEVRVCDVTRETSWAHAARALAFLRSAHEAGTIDDDQLRLGIEGRMARAAACRAYVTISARRPVADPTPWATGAPYLAALRDALVATARL